MLKKLCLGYLYVSTALAAKVITRGDNETTIRINTAFDTDIEMLGTGNFTIPETLDQGCQACETNRPFGNGDIINIYSGETVGHIDQKKQSLKINPSITPIDFPPPKECKDPNFDPRGKKATIPKGSKKIFSDPCDPTTKITMEFKQDTPLPELCGRFGVIGLKNRKKRFINLDTGKQTPLSEDQLEVRFTK